MVEKSTKKTTKKRVNTKSSTWEKTLLPNLDKIAELRQQGNTTAEICTALNVTSRQMYYSIQHHKELRDVMESSQEILYTNIEDTARAGLIEKLRDRMIVTEEKIKDGEVVSQTRKLVKADTTAIIFALKSRNPAIWDALGLARINDSKDTEDVNKEILDALKAYEPRPTNQNIQQKMIKRSKK